jgi:hypothetical protein
MVDQILLKKILLSKEAYAPPMPAGGGMDMTGGMPQDPAMMAAAMPPAGAPMGGGAAPMDPGAMGGAMPPGGAPMDPSMVGGLPPSGMPPMDPSMGGAPPMDPSMGGMPPIMLSAQDLQMLIEQAATGAGTAPEAPPEEAPAEDPAADGRVTNKELMERVDSLENMLGQVMSALNISPDEGMMSPQDMPLSPTEGADTAAAMATEGAIPESFGTPEAGGMPAPEMPTQGILPMDMGPKVASDNREQLSAILSQLNTYR